MRSDRRRPLEFIITILYYRHGGLHSQKMRKQVPTCAHKGHGSAPVRHIGHQSRVSPVGPERAPGPLAFHLDVQPPIPRCMSYHLR